MNNDNIRPGIIEYGSEENVDLGFKPFDFDYNIEPKTKDDTTKRKVGRPRKEPNGVCISAEEAAKEGNNSTLPVRFKDSYMETDALLRQSLMEIDSANAYLQKDLSDIRNSRTLKNKYGYIKDLLPSQSQLINTKVSVIREMNNIIGKINDMEYKRTKDFKSGEDTNTDKLIMDLYTSMISNPASFQGMNQPTLSTNAFIPQTSDCIGSEPNMYPEVESGFQGYMNTVTPEQNMMILEGNPNIKTVVCYNMNSGSSYFDVYDMSTNQPVPNVPRKNPMFLERTQIDIEAGVARNTDLRETYPLIIVSDSAMDNRIKSDF